jgi:hypothetical protein
MGRGKVRILLALTPSLSPEARVSDATWRDILHVIVAVTGNCPSG